jgi:hypothetical protein
LREDGFEAERLLLSWVGYFENLHAPRSLTEVRVRELFGSILHTEAVDSEDDEVTWVETTLGSTADFFAVTAGHQFVNLVPRHTAVNAVLLALASHGGRSNGRESQRKNEGLFARGEPNFPARSDACPQDRREKHEWQLTPRWSSSTTNSTVKLVHLRRQLFDCVRKTSQ